MTIAVELDHMTTTEKLQLLENLWDDLTRQPTNVPSPDWHAEVLHQREQSIADGSARLLDIPEAKQLVRDILG